jgi:hypothetical protein
MGNRKGKRKMRNVPPVPPASVVERLVTGNGNSTGLTDAARAPDGGSLNGGPPAISPTVEVPESLYLEHRKILLDLVKENTTQHDKAILQLTAGALGLTVTFISNIVAHPLADTLIWLAVGWGCLIGSMASTVSSFLTGQWACRRAVAFWDRCAREGMREERTSFFSILTTILNHLACVLFLVGVGFVTYFSWLNVSASSIPQAPSNVQPHTGEAEMPTNPDRPKPSIPSPSPKPSQPKPETGHSPPSTPAIPTKPSQPPEKK